MIEKLTFLIVIVLLAVLVSSAKQKKLTADGDLLKAAADGDLDKVKRLVEEEMASVIARNNFGVSAIIQAANNGHTNVVEALVNYGANIEDESNNGKTSLHWACYWGHYSTVQLLIQKGANISAIDVEGMTPLMSATFKKHILIVKLLLRKGASVLTTNDHGATALTIAKNQDNPNLVAVLEEAYRKQIKEVKESSDSKFRKKTKKSTETSPLLKLLRYDYWNNLENDSSPFIILAKLIIRESIFMLEISKEEILHVYEIFRETTDGLWEITAYFTGAFKSDHVQGPNNQESLNNGKGNIEL